MAPVLQGSERPPGNRLASRQRGSWGRARLGLDEGYRVPRRLARPVRSNEQDVWHTVTDPTKQPHEHILRSDTQRKDILRLIPQMDTIIRKNKKANGKRIEQWQVTKFRDLRRQKINASDPTNLKSIRGRDIPLAI